VSGVFELAEYIREYPKPVAAYVDSMAYSAAYLIASQADVVVCTQSGGVGSIGAMMVHQEISKAAEQKGITFTIVQSGSHKSDGNNLQPLPEAVQAKIQDRVDLVRDQFSRSVAQGRGERFSYEDAMATEADTYTADQAMEMGLIDGIARPDRALSAIAELLEANKGEGLMTDTPSGEARNEIDPEVLASARSEGMAAGVQQERSRVSAISAAGVGKPKETVQAMISNGVDADMAASILATIPDEKAIEPITGRFDAGAGATDLPDEAPQMTRAEETKQRIGKIAYI